MKTKNGALIGSIQVFTFDRALEVFKVYVKECYANLSMESVSVLDNVRNDLKDFVGLTDAEIEKIEINTIQ